MCLLVFVWQTEPAYSLVVAANRDERFERPAQSLCVLRDRDPRILGGRDDLAGGTWLAVNQHGVVAGLTNRPSPGGRDLSKRSRGELPLMAAEQRTAHDAVHELARHVRPGRLQPGMAPGGDRDSLHYVEIAADRPPSFRVLSPGIHILENVALGERSLKVDRVRSLMAAATSNGEPLWTALPTVLADHTVPTAEGEVRPEVAEGGAEARHPGVVRAHRRLWHPLGGSRTSPDRPHRPTGHAGGRRSALHRPVHRRALCRRDRNCPAPGSLTAAGLAGRHAVLHGPAWG